MKRFRKIVGEGFAQKPAKRVEECSPGWSAAEPWVRDDEAIQGRETGSRYWLSPSSARVNSATASQGSRPGLYAAARLRGLNSERQARKPWLCLLLFLVFLLGVTVASRLPERSAQA